MAVRVIQPGQPINVARGHCVVCIPVYRGHEHFLECLDSVLAHTPAEVRVMVCDDASPDERTRAHVVEQLGAEVSERELVYSRQPRNVGFPANVNAALRATAPADVVLLNSDCVVAEGWLAGLREAAYSDRRVATVTALTNHGSLVSVPDGHPRPDLPPGWNLADAAAAIGAASLRIHPRLPTAVGHCVYIRRSAIELVGSFDIAFTPGYGEEVDFSQRCLQVGLSHVLADDVFVLHHGGGSFSPHGARSPLQQEHERLLARRYPYYHRAVRAIQDDTTGPLQRALGRARRVLSGMAVTIDARVLEGPTTGTQLHVLELLGALAGVEGMHVSAIIPARADPWIEKALSGMAGVKRLTRSQAEAQAAPHRKADVVHRPFQVNHEEDLAFLASLGERLVITNQDLIGFQNPAYFSDAAAWEGYRRTTRTALAIADRVVFFSRHARQEALAEDLVDPARADVVHIGVDHQARGPVTPLPPQQADILPDASEAILCIGTDFHHKNRLFALRVLRELRDRHGWPGYMVFAGPSVAQGSSAPQEHELLSCDPALAERVLDFGAVSEAEKEWLYGRARLVLYPTVYEGFGLVPFESADHGVPCMWSEGTSLAEVLPESAAEIVPWDAERSAECALTLLRDSEAREANLAAIRAAAAELSWERTARGLHEVYSAACDAPPTALSGLERREGMMSGALSEDAMRLLGPGGALPEELERPLLALATHPGISTPMFRAIKLGYRASYALRRRVPRRGSRD